MKEKLQEMSRKILVYCAGLLVMAMGASFSGKAGLAISMALIALGSAAATAADCRMDSRILFSAGRAALSLGLMGENVKLIYGLPLAVTGKSPFFDRKKKA